MEPIFPVLPGEFQELTPVLCSEKRARTEWGFRIWVRFLALLLSLGLKFQLCHVKGSGQDLTSIRHLWDTGRQKYVEGEGIEKKKSQISSWMPGSTWLHKQGIFFWRVTTFSSAVLLLGSPGLAKPPRNIFCVYSHIQPQSPQSPPLLTCLHKQTFQGYFYPKEGFAQIPLCLPSKGINRI